MNKNKLPPCDIKAERAILGIILTDNTYFEQALNNWIEVKTFCDDRNRSIYHWINNLYFDCNTCDAVTLVERLNSLGRLHHIGGTQYLDYLLSEKHDISLFDDYCKIIIEKYTLRELNDTGSEIVTQCHTTKESVY